MFIQQVSAHRVGSWSCRALGWSSMSPRVSPARAPGALHWSPSPRGPLTFWLVPRELLRHAPYFLAHTPGAVKVSPGLSGSCPGGCRGMPRTLWLVPREPVQGGPSPFPLVPFPIERWCTRAISLCHCGPLHNNPSFYIQQLLLLTCKQHDLLQQQQLRYNNTIHHLHCRAQFAQQMGPDQK